jgi:hypothetical protein
MASDDRRAERLRQLYLDMMQHTEATTEWLDRRTEDTTVASGISPTSAVATVQLTPQVDLFAEPSLFKVWTEYTWQVEVVAEHFRLNEPHAAQLDEDFKTAELQESLRAVKDAVRQAAQDI